jgi:hypothetical protein
VFSRFVELVQRFPPPDLAGVVLILGALASLFCGGFRARGELRWQLPLPLFIVLCGVFLLSDKFLPQLGPHRGALALLAILSLIAHLLSLRLAAVSCPESPEPPEKAGDPPTLDTPSLEETLEKPETPPISSEEPAETEQPKKKAVLGSIREALPSASPAVVYLGILLVLMSFFLLKDLGTFNGRLFTWESPITQIFAEVFHEGTTPFEYLLRQTRWDDALLGRSENSLLYGAPTYALYRWFGFTVFNMRIASVVAALLTVVTMFLLARKFFGSTVAVASVAFLASSTVYLYYARYGGCLAANMLAVLLAIWALWLFVREDRNPLWTGPLLGAALCLATMQYAPGRLAVIVMLAWGAVWLVLRGWFSFERRFKERDYRGFDWKRPLGILLLVLILIAFWKYQESYGTHENFHKARGEQFLTFLTDPYYIKDYLNRDIAPSRMTAYEKAELLFRVIERTIPQYFGFWTPTFDLGIPGQTMLIADPPTLKMFYPQLVPFILLGLLFSLRQWRSFPHTFLLVWVAVASGPLFLTNRVDIHRLSLFILPLSLWAAFGAAECAQGMRRLRVPVWIRHFLGILFMTTLFIQAIYSATYEKPPVWQQRNFIIEEARKVRGPLTLVVEGDHMEVSRIYLDLLEQERRNPDESVKLYPWPQFHELVAGSGNPTPQQISTLERNIAGTTAGFFPATRFGTVAEALEKRGAQVEAVPQGLPRILFVSLEKKAIVIQSPASEAPEGDRASGKEVFLSTLEPLKVEQGFLPPRFDRNVNGDDIVMDGEIYFRGIGMHAWTRMAFAVPSGATYFRSVIGLSDVQGHCEHLADVVFEVQDEEGRLLFTSGILSPSDPPREIEVPLGHAKEIRLVVTEGEKGRDCDHANWGNPRFIIPETSP